MTHRFVLFCEDSLHCRTVHTVTDALLRARVPWLSDFEDLEHFREWILDDESRRNGQRYLSLSRGHRGFGEGFRPRAHGHFDNEPGAPDSRLFRECILHARRLEADVAFFARDTDGADRLSGVRQAIERDRRESRTPIRFVRAIAAPEMEAWAIATWEVRGDSSVEVLAQIRKQIGFDPVLYPTRLVSKRETSSAKNAKVIAERLGAVEVATDTGHLRLVCSSLDRLKQADLGLAMFLDDVESEVAPLFVTSRT